MGLWQVHRVWLFEMVADYANYSLQTLPAMVTDGVHMVGPLRCPAGSWITNLWRLLGQKLASLRWLHLVETINGWSTVILPFFHTLEPLLCMWARNTRIRFHFLGSLAANCGHKSIFWPMRCIWKDWVTSYRKPCVITADMDLWVPLVIFFKSFPFLLARMWAMAGT